MLAWLIALLAGAAGALQAGDGPPADAAAYLPEHPALNARLNDLARSRERFAASPYAALARTAWGRALVDRLHGQAGAGQPAGLDPLAIAGCLGEVAAGVAVGPQRADIGIAARTTGDTRALQAWCAELLGTEARQGLPGTDHVWLGGAGQITQQGALMIFQSAPAEGGAVEAARVHQAGARFDGRACLEAVLDASRIEQLVALFDSEPVPAAASGPRFQLGFTASLDPIGVRERLVVGGLPEPLLEAVRGLVAKPADLGLLRSLPAATLCAAVAHADASGIANALARSGLGAGDPRVAGIDAGLLALGLPGALQLLGALDGDLLLYLEEGSPWPSATLAVGMQREMAQRLLATLTTSCALVPSGDGVVAGLVGPVMLAGCFRDGQLVLTTNPAGVASFAQRAPGFAAHPEVVAALAEISPGAVAAGVSRSGAVWSALYRLAWVPLSLAGADARFATIGEDLRAQGRHGFLSLGLHDGGLVLDGGGMAGGAVGTLTAAVAAVAWYVEEGLTGLPAVAPAAPAAAHPVGGVF
jgi:hypothetical protein